MKFKSGTAAGALALTLLLTGAVGTAAFAANADNSTAPTAAQQTPTAETQSSDTSGSEDSAALAAQAKISEAEAIAIAEKANAGYTFTVKELDSENSVVVYDLTGSDQSGTQKEVTVNAEDGTILTDNEQDGKDTENDAQKQADLAAQATLTEADAIAAAESANSGYTFSVDELDSENGVIAYDLNGTDASGATLEVQVNAADGSILQDSETDQD